tara:strand:- start:1089 stop:2123 length:1035 start_codon:yes stop_codon:yes gene_type:complete
MKPIKVSIIIPHYNNKTIISNCLNSLCKLSFKDLEIIVVDNNSSDDSIDYIRTKYKDIKIISSSNNLGYAGGCNLGSKNAQGEYLLFINNDTEHEYNFIEPLVEKLDSDNNISSVQPKIKNIKNKIKYDYAGACGGYLDYLVFPYTRGRIFNTIENDDGQYDNSVQIFWASGATFITRKKIYDKIQGFDEDLFAHMEEIDYHWKCQLMNYEVWVEPLSVVYHHTGKTLDQNSPKKTFLNHRNSLLLLLTNYSLGLSLYLFIIRFFYELLSSFYDLLRLKPIHFLMHYKALLSVLFNIKLIINRREKNKLIRKISDLELLNQNNIKNKSIVILYFLFGKKTFQEL